MMIKPRDIFDINTSKGVAYFQFVKKIPPMGSLIRVLPGVYDGASLDHCILAGKDTNFWIFFPVSAALKRKIVRIIDHCDIPLHAQKTPVFRSGVVDPRSGKVENWWLWDGEKEWRVGSITAEQRKLPIRSVWNDTLLIQRIEEDWRPEKDGR